LFRWFRRPTREELVRDVEAAMDAEEWDRAANLGRKAVRRWPEDAKIWHLVGQVAFGIERPDEALEAMNRAVELDPEWVDAHVGAIQALLEMSLVDEAVSEAEGLARDVPDDALVVHLLATALEIAGQSGRANRLYKRAEALDPDHFFAPARVSRQRFDELTRAAISRLPDDIQAALENIEIVVKDVPHEGDVGEGEPPLNPTLLGVFMGFHRGEQSLEDPWTTAFPARILLFQRNIERVCHDHEELERQIGITVFHEVGHYLGLSEEEVHARGLG
jgi:predicted Zn-dependent protease with MMP-like domain